MLGQQKKIDILYNLLKSKYPKQAQKIANNPNLKSISIACPFHRDTSPSLSIIINKKNMPFGTFKCFGCGKTGNLALLADKIKADSSIKKVIYKIFKKKEKEIPFDDEKYDIEPVISEDNFFKLWHNYIIENKECYTLLKRSYTLPKELRMWRGIPVNILKAIKARYYYDIKEQDFKLLFPWILNDNIVGATKVKIIKDYGISYLDCVDSPKNKYLFPFDLILNKSNYNFVVLVEGFRDALGLIKEGIPALAILGTKSWGYYKKKLLKNLPIEYILLMFDNDDAGREANNNIKEDLLKEDYFEVKTIEYPKNIKDPFKLVKEYPTVFYKIKKKIFSQISFHK